MRQWHKPEPRQKVGKRERFANYYLLRHVLNNGPICDYDRETGEVRNPERLHRVLAAKHQIVSQVVKDEADGSPWDDADFEDTLANAISNALAAPV